MKRLNHALAARACRRDLLRGRKAKGDRQVAGSAATSLNMRRRCAVRLWPPHLASQSLPLAGIWAKTSPMLFSGPPETQKFARTDREH